MGESGIGRDYCELGSRESGANGNAGQSHDKDAVCTQPSRFMCLRYLSSAYPASHETPLCTDSKLLLRQSMPTFRGPPAE